MFYVILYNMQYIQQIDSEDRQIDWVLSERGRNLVVMGFELGGVGWGKL